MPRIFTTFSGITILVGKNAKENDMLCLASDMIPFYRWFHAKDVPGAHVILQSEFVTEADILEAAALALHFSKAENKLNGLVEHCLLKDVYKPPRSTPGEVVTRNSVTLRLKNRK